MIGVRVASVLLHIHSVSGLNTWAHPHTIAFLRTTTLFSVCNVENSNEPELFRLKSPGIMLVCSYLFLPLISFTISCFLFLRALSSFYVLSFLPTSSFFCFVSHIILFFLFPLHLFSPLLFLSYLSPHLLFLSQLSLSSFISSY